MTQIQQAQTIELKLRCAADANQYNCPFLAYRCPCCGDGPCPYDVDKLNQPKPQRKGQKK